jgi:FlaA1/EpsC-like NDP-sugar epimerase
MPVMIQPFQWQRVLLVFGDALLCALALYIAYLLRNDFAIPRAYERQYLLALLLVVPVHLLCFAAFDLYRGLLRYVGLREMMAIVGASATSLVLLIVTNGILPMVTPVISWLPHHPGGIERVSLGILPTSALLTVLLVGGMRVSRRLLLLTQVRRRPEGEAVRRVLIIGAGDAGEAVCRQMLHSLSADHIPVAFLDDDPAKRNRRIHGKPVVGGIADLPTAIKVHEVDEVVVAIPKVPPAILRRIVDLCGHAQASLRILPAYSDVMSGRVSISHIRSVEIEDLLGRAPIRLELPTDRNYLANETVLVSGAGGSIGSELVRQVLGHGASHVILLGHGENSIYEIQTELMGEHGSRLTPVIADVRDRDKLCHVLETYQPRVIFHAAAHKHVPLMEGDPDEAVRNNITGTRNLATLSQKLGVRKFILISSDKAVRPTNVMGATKRVAEMILFDLARRQPDATQFVAVRFGNVLGSRGSVVPLFRKQIARGGPVTLTHPDVTRFFMTIPEAVSLVIQAGSMDEQRRLFLLDMGQAVRIQDLARNLIRLSGYEPDVDIEIRYTGLRPGEKLFEELLTDEEGVRATPMGKVFITEPDTLESDVLARSVEHLEAAAAHFDATAIRQVLQDLVPDYHPTSSHPASSS